MAQPESETSHPRFAYYLALMEDTTKLSDRRQTTNDLFVGLNVVFFTGMGVLFYNSHLNTWWVTGLYAAITVLALMLNATWIRLITRYSRLVRLRIQYMEQLELALATEDIFVTPPAGAEKGKMRKPKDTTVPVEAPDQTAPGSASPLPPGSGIFAVEYHALYHRSQFGFSGLERGIILIFMFAYVFATVGVAVVTYLIMTHMISAVSL
ncbi:MAG: hypothetical protein ACLQUY_27345 [Ktedonobacterales bacterium]